MLLGLLVIWLLAGCGSSEVPRTPADDGNAPRRSEFPNLLDAQAAPACFLDTSVSFAFSDLGAWHGFLLPDPEQPRTLGGFGGPLLHSVYVWLGPSFIKLQLADAAGRPLEIKLSGELTFLPGMLSQRLDAGEVTAALDLVFADDRTALIRLRLVAPPGRSASVRVGWGGSVFAGVAALAVRPDGGVAATLRNDRYGGNAHVVFPAVANAEAVIGPSGLSWEAWCGGPLSLAAGQVWETCVAVPFYTTQAERQEREAALPALLAGAAQIFADNETRWNGYLARVLPRDNRWASEPRYRALAVKALVTLVDNWRSAAGDPKFNPENGYWRGMVWLDQAWFGVEALRRYGYEAEAEEMIRRLLERAEGALDPGGAFRENYNPLTGAGARAEHFSWTAGHFLMWFCE
jgi:putative isomerase